MRSQRHAKLRFACARQRGCSLGIASCELVEMGFERAVHHRPQGALAAISIRRFCTLWLDTAQATPPASAWCPSHCLGRKFSAAVVEPIALPTGQAQSRIAINVQTNSRTETTKLHRAFASGANAAALLASVVLEPTESRQASIPLRAIHVVSIAGRHSERIGRAVWCVGDRCLGHDRNVLDCEQSFTAGHSTARFDWHGQRS